MALTAPVEQSECFC